MLSLRLEDYQYPDFGELVCYNQMEEPKHWTASCPGLIFWDYQYRLAASLILDENSFYEPDSTSSFNRAHKWAP